MQLYAEAVRGHISSSAEVRVLVGRPGCHFKVGRAPKFVQILSS